MNFIARQLVQANRQHATLMTPDRAAQAARQLAGIRHQLEAQRALTPVLWGSGSLTLEVSGSLHQAAHPSF